MTIFYSSKIQNDWVKRQCSYFFCTGSKLIRISSLKWILNLTNIRDWAWIQCFLTSCQYAKLLKQEFRSNMISIPDCRQKSIFPNNLSIASAIVYFTLRYCWCNLVNNSEYTVVKACICNLNVKLFNTFGKCRKSFFSTDFHIH